MVQTWNGLGIPLPGITRLVTDIVDDAAATREVVCEPMYD